MPTASKSTKKPAARVHRALPAATATVFTDRRIALLVTFLALVVGALAAATVVGISQSQSNGEVLAIIKDSVDPGGKRFQRGQAQTAEAVGQINEVTQLAVFCAKKYDDVPSIQGCVLYEYRRAHPLMATTSTTR